MASLETWLEVGGRLHPVLLHLPIGLLIGAGAVETLAVLRRCGPSPTALACVGLGALAAAFAAGSGWLFAADEEASDTLFWHRWAGVAMPVLAAAVWGLGLRAASGKGRGIYRGGLVALLLLVLWTGHLGGELVWGEDFITAPLRGDANGLAADAEPDAVTREGEPDDTLLVVDFDTEVLPIFASRCVRCHGPKRQKGRLRLDGIERIFVGEEADWVIVPGRPDESRLMQVLALPPDHEDFMPKNGDPLTAAELDLLRRWIAGGASAPPR